MTTHKIHDLASLKTSIKANAAETRATRDVARTLTGMERWYKQREAEYDADTQRYQLLAYGYLRGKSISQMESPVSDPDEIPSAAGILGFAQSYFNLGPDGPDNPADWDEFSAFVENDITAWKSKVRANHALRAASQRVA